MQSRGRSLLLLAFAGSLGLGSVACNNLTQPDEIVIAPEPKRSPPPTPQPAAAAPAAPTPHPGGAPPSGG